MDYEMITLGQGRFKIVMSDGTSLEFVWLDDEHEMAVCTTCGSVVPCGWDTGNWTPEHMAWHAKN